VLSRNPVAPKPTERVPVHVGDQWWAFRGDFLKLSEDKARLAFKRVAHKLPIRVKLLRRLPNT